LNQETPESYEYDDDTGNLGEKNNLALDYPAANESDPTHPHAVASVAINNVIVNAYSYDQNGNQTRREIGADTFDLKYDAENRLVEVKKNNAIVSQFTYDGNGQRVKSVINGETIRFVGGYYERKGSTITKYYMAGATRVAMRKYTIPQNMTVEYMLGDHLGSTSITTDTAGEQVSEIRYKPWGETRYSSMDAPANTSPAYELVKYQFTGQYSYDVEFGLKYYGARFYDSSVGRFVSADTMIPQSQGTQAYDRYAYTNNNPVKYTDPSGHFIPLLMAGAIIGVIVAAPIILSRFGLTPDVYGVIAAGAVNMNQGGDALVMAGIAVQSGNPVAMFSGDDQGWAQASGSELMDGQKDPFSAAVATDIMEKRIYDAIGACTKCNSAVDKLVVAALAQNRFDFSSKGIGRFPMSEDGNIDWGKFLSTNGGNPSSWVAGIRQDITGQNYDTQLMLKIYIQDLLLLVSMGYELPDWLTEEDIQYIVDNDYFYEEEDE